MCKHESINYTALFEGNCGTSTSHFAPVPTSTSTVMEERHLPSCGTSKVVVFTVEEVFTNSFVVDCFYAVYVVAETSTDTVTSNKTAFGKHSVYIQRGNRYTKCQAMLLMHNNVFDFNLQFVITNFKFVQAINIHNALSTLSTLIMQIHSPSTHLQ